jgi:hypothetical protein
VPEGAVGELPAGMAALPLVDAPPSEILLAGPAEGAGAAAAAYADAVRAASPRAPLRLAA